MNKGAEKSGFPWGFVLLSSIVWGYIWLRAGYLQITIDEAATFFMYLQPGRFIPPFAVVDANNHLLNSLLSWFCYLMFGPVPLALRLPNILAAILYFYFIFQLGKIFTNKFPRWIFFLLALGIHFVIEFFGYTRGYGLSMASLTGALYYTFLLNEKFRSSSLYKAYLLVLLGILANFNLIFTALALLVVISLLVWNKWIMMSGRSRVALILFHLLVLLPSIAYVTFAAFEIRSHSGFYYGAPDGFVTTTAGSLANVLAGPWGIYLSIYIFILAGIIAIFSIRRLFSRKYAQFGLMPVIAVGFVLFANWAGSLMLHYIWGVNFQEDRAAMHYVPLILIFLMMGLDRLSQTRFPLAWLVAVPLLLLPVYSVSRISLESGIYGPRQIAPEKYFEYISAKSEVRDFPPIVSAWQTRKQPWAFLNYTHGGRLNPIQSNEYPLEEADYIILENDCVHEMPAGFREVQRDEASSTILYERSEPAEWKQYDSLAILSHYNTPDPFENLYEFSLEGDSISGILVQLECCIHSRFRPFEAVMVLEAFGKKKETLRYEAIDLDQLRPKWRQAAGNFRYSLLISDIPPEADSVLLYFWNKKQALCTIEEARAEIFHQ